ncbi:MAG: T9SS type A sorting domain-containing protein [Bacteroidota bacterium]|nr:T9SS type A sorting domain-containing protein [Bacteroidota bacterium]
MKYLYTTVLLIILHSALIPNKALSTNDNQLITEIRVFDNDSTFRYLYLYDNLGNKVLETKYFQQGSNWIRQSLNEWIYDGNKCVTQRERVWKDGGWAITYTIGYEYNNGQLTSEVHNTYNSSGVATLLKKIDSQYDISTLVSKKEYAWQSNAWILSIENDFAYLPNGSTGSITTTNYQSGNITNQQLSTFIYNQDGTLQSQLFQEEAGNVWVNSELINWFYVPNSSLIASVRNKKWIADTSSWENTQMIDYQYNDSSKLVSETYQRWNAMFWENDTRYDYQYDSSNNLLRKTLSQPIYNEWRGLVSINYSNFTQDRATDIESMFDFWGGNTGELTTSYIPFMFNSDMSIQKGRSIQISYIPVINTALYPPVGNNSIQMIPVYPNPSDGIFYINTQECDVKSWTASDLSGRILKKQVQAFQSGVIDLTDYPKGIYILQVTTPDGQMIQKLIKE